MITKNVTTLNLSGETTVQFDKGYDYFFVSNLSGNDVMISMSSGITDGADGVIIVPEGSSAGTMHGYSANTVYVKGTGKVQVMGTYSAFNPFKKSQKGGEIKTVSGSNITINSVEFPLLALTAYGRSWQGSCIVNIADVGIEGYGIPVSNGGNYTDSNGQQWVCDELIVNADGTGKIINRIAKELLEEKFNETVVAGMNLKYVYAHPAIAKERYNGFCNCFNGNGSLQSGNNVCRFDSGTIYIRADEYSVEELTAYAKENPIIVVYQLAAPTENELTPEQLTALQPLIEKYGAFTVYFVSTQNGTPTPENTVDIVSTADLHRVSVPIESIGDSGSVTVTTCGKNLYNAAAATKEAVYPTGEIVSNEYMLLSDYIPCCNISNITVSGIVDTGVVAYRIAKYDNNKSFIERLVAANVSTGAYIFDVSDCCYFRFSCENNPTISATASSVQIECGLKATEYEPYKSITASITTALPLCGIPVSSGGNYTDGSGQEWVCDTLEYNYTAAVKKQRVAVIDSYNGETVESDYISTTGGLDVSASVIYPAETVTETPLTADEINQLRNLETFGGVTNIYNSENANMSVEYLTSKAASKAVMPIITVLRGDSNA